MVEITAVNKFHSLGILGVRGVVLLLLRGMGFYVPDGALDYIAGMALMLFGSLFYN